MLLATLPALLLSVLLIAPAEAATATVTVSPATGAPGAALSLTGKGFPASTTATLTWDGSTVLGRPRVDAGGTFSAAPAIPSTAPAGTHSLAVRDGSLTVTLTITVQATGTSRPASSPTAAPAPTPAVAATSTVSPVDRVLQLVNGARTQAGLTPLAANAALASAARSYSGLMASTSCFSHTCPPVADFSQRDTQAGYTSWTNLGENIAAGYQTADDVFAGWMNSPGHKANILNPSFRETGVGVANGGSYGIYWTQEFGAR